MRQFAATLLWLRDGPDEVQSLVAGLDLVRRAAAEDASEAWLCMIANGTAHYLSTYAAGDLLSRAYSGTNQVYGVVAQVGRLGSGPDGGLVVDGRWRFGSGADRAAYMAMGCEPVRGARTTVLVDRARLHVDQPWEGPGLLGTTSHTLSARDVGVDPEDVVDMSSIPTDRPRGIYADAALFLANMPGVAIGLAERLLELLGPGLSPGSPWQVAYAEAETRTILARRGLIGMLHSFDVLARDGRLQPFAPALRAEYHAVLSAAYHVCLEAVLALVEACDSADPGVAQRLAEARLDAVTMKPHAAMRPHR
ncbi:hypothetical protein [Micromonospora okii]|uniref:hypothetical protein n=1 Tax=Micromonospora okii TaxID=1182970 RepID=UPI001E58FE36|nr:hypothetical protein [Micromonospora okii]